MKAALVGLGAIGTVIAADLAQNDFPLHVVCKHQETLEMIENRGLKVIGISGDYVVKDNIIPVLTIEDLPKNLDLVFYNRLAKCFVLIDLKIGKLTHQDLGQMQMYVNFYKRTQMIEDENEPIGILLCSEKNEAVVKFTLPENQKQIFASKYKLYLPTEEELKKELLREREIIETAKLVNRAKARAETSPGTVGIKVAIMPKDVKIPDRINVEGENGSA